MINRFYNNYADVDELNLDLVYSLFDEDRRVEIVSNTIGRLKEDVEEALKEILNGYEGYIYEVDDELSYRQDKINHLLTRIKTLEKRLEDKGENVEDGWDEWDF